MLGWVFLTSEGDIYKLGGIGLKSLPMTAAVGCSSAAVNQQNILYPLNDVCYRNLWPTFQFPYLNQARDVGLS